MAISIEKEGKTVSDATISACEDLGVARSEIEVEVLDEGSKGVFGIGIRYARVMVNIKNHNLILKRLKVQKSPRRHPRLSHPDLSGGPPREPRQDKARNPGHERQGPPDRQERGDD
ncbi:MAG: Jag N-terminal domain-containing protein [Candidatus Dadabacteria bacterium]|nr:Jag N-terminal domain-containing protein [Candidatus Dadabacteria bacterium]